MRLDPDEKVDEQDSIIFNSTLTLPKTKISLPTKIYIVKKFIDPSKIKDTAHVDFSNENLDNNRFVKVNSIPAVRKHQTPKFYVDQVFLLMWINHRC